MNPTNSYQPVGPEVEVPPRRDHGKIYSGGIQKRPLALGPCERRAYQEAKKLYLSPIQAERAAAQEDLSALREPVKPFHIRHVDSMKEQNRVS